MSMAPGPSEAVSDPEESNDLSITSESWNRVSFVDVKKRHKFIIEDFRRWTRWVGGYDRPVVLKGPVFTLQGRDVSGESKQYKFNLQVTAAGMGGSNNISVLLNNMGEDPVFVRCQMFVEGDGSPDGPTFSFLTKEVLLNPQGEGGAPIFGSFRRENIVEKMKNYLINGRLVIICDLQLKYNPITKNFEEPFLPELEMDTKTLTQDLAMLYDDTTLSDVVLNCEGRRFTAHKVILAMRSKYFKAMFSHPTSENETRVVDIKEMEASTMEKVLKFIYTDEVDQLTIDTSLFIAADMYELQKLRAICEAVLKTRVDQENAAELLLLGYLHGAPDLKEAALDCIVSNFSTVKETPGWQAIVNGHAKLMDEVLTIVLVGGPSSALKLNLKKQYSSRLCLKIRSRPTKKAVTFAAGANRL